MSKYTFEFKKQVVLEYFRGEGGYKILAKKYHISSPAVLERWVAAYNAYGEEGLMRSREKQNYSFEFKLAAVESYLTSEISYQELALKLGLTNPSLIARWVIDFRAHGPDALRPKKKGRKSLKKDNAEAKKESALTAQSRADQPASDANRIRELEDELLKLRIENAFLKELRRLRLEEEALQKKQQESFTVSEENSN